jgi:hypothetical protein
MALRRLLGSGIAILAFAWADAGMAALAPNYERLRELEAILGSQDLQQKLGAEPIQGIEATGPDNYRVWTARCSITVNLVSTPSNPPIPGPRQFAIQIGDPQCH